MTLYEIGAPSRPLKAASRVPILDAPAGGFGVFSRCGRLGIVTGSLLFEFPSAVTLTEVRCVVGTAPTGDDIIIDVVKNGVSMFAADIDRPHILDGSQTGDSSAFDDAAAGPGDLLRIDILQVGSTEPGRDLTVILVP